MKVSDEQLLDLIWDEALSQIARRTVVHYIGNYLGTYSEEDIRKNYRWRLDYFSSLSIPKIKDGALLCESQLRLRVNRLVEKGLLVRVGASHFMFAPEKLIEVAVLAVRCWQAAGLPYGYDDTGKRSNCVPAENFNLFALSQHCYVILRQQYPTYKETK